MVLWPTPSWDHHLPSPPQPPNLFLGPGVKRMFLVKGRREHWRWLGLIQRNRCYLDDIMFSLKFTALKIFFFKIISYQCKGLWSLLKQMLFTICASENSARGVCTETHRILLCLGNALSRSRLCYQSPSSRKRKACCGYGLVFCASNGESLLKPWV